MSVYIELFKQVPVCRYIVHDLTRNSSPLMNTDGQPLFSLHMKPIAILSSYAVCMKPTSYYVALLLLLPQLLSFNIWRKPALHKYVNETWF